MNNFKAYKQSIVIKKTLERALSTPYLDLVKENQVRNWLRKGEEITMDW
jgi:hypothetical protein